MTASADWRVRDLRQDDRDAWEVIWRQYLDFYGEALLQEITDHVFARLADPGDDEMFGLVAVDGEDDVVGLANVVVHANTWSDRDDAYLEDLATREDMRGTGVGRALIEALVDRGRRQGWRRVHWHTEQSNARARRLYDGVGDLTDDVRYVRPLARDDG